MADTLTTAKQEESSSTGVDPHQAAKVFDTNGPDVNRQQDAAQSGADHDNTLDDVGFAHADLQNAEVIRGDATAAEFRTTDLRGSELHTTARNATDLEPVKRTADPARGTNWSTIFMVIALILVIILVASWLL